MTPTTITILAVAAYFAVGYGASIYVYVKGSNATGEPGYDPAGEAAQAFCLWPLLMLTIPHRYFAALVKKLNTPAPVQVSGAFAGGGKCQCGGFPQTAMTTGVCILCGKQSMPNV
jgi:hypothetical protein